MLCMCMHHAAGMNFVIKIYSLNLKNPCKKMQSQRSTVLGCVVKRDNVQFPLWASKALVFLIETVVGLLSLFCDIPLQSVLSEGRHLELFIVLRLVIGQSSSQRANAKTFNIRKARCRKDIVFLLLHLGNNNFSIAFVVKISFSFSLFVV